MAERPTTFKPGQSGNPKGRPPKGRALTDLLEKALNAKIDGPDGKAVARKALMAERIAEAVATGYLTLPKPDGEGEARVPLSVQDWSQLARWLYTHVDGAKVLAEHSGEGGGPVRWIVEEAPKRGPDDA